MTVKKQDYMRVALDIAKDAAKDGEVPVGAVVICNQTGEIIATAANRTEEDGDPIAHAEMIAIRAACDRLGQKRLPLCDIYVTLEPCPMCAAAISFARIRRLVFGAYDVKSGGVVSGVPFYGQRNCHHRPEVIGGVNEVEAKKILQDFFEARR